MDEIRLYELQIVVFQSGRARRVEQAKMQSRGGCHLTSVGSHFTTTVRISRSFLCTKGMSPSGPNADGRPVELRVDVPR